MLTWVMFVLGQACYFLLQIWAIVRAPNNTATSWSSVLKARWPRIVVRGIAGLMLFWLFLAGGLPAMLAAFKIEQPMWLEAMSAVINSAAGPPLAWFGGLGIDGLLGFIPFLKAYLPTETVVASQSTQAALDPATGAVRTVKKTEEVVVSPAPESPKV